MIAVLRKHPSFRALWSAQVVSNAGDWFGRIAMITLIGRLGSTDDLVRGVGLLIGLEFAARMVPMAMLGPIAGPFADRFDRRRLMVVSDVLRALVVLGYLLVDSPDRLWLVYMLLPLHMGLGVFFESARSAALPNTVDPDDLHEAYALSAITWSTMLGLGAALGGLATELFDVRTVFVIDAASYAVSALCLLGVHLPARPRPETPLRMIHLMRLTDLRAGLDHVTSRRLRHVLFAKTYWWPCGAFLVFLSLAGQTRDPENAAAATGWLFAARGIGTGFGPIVGKRLFGKDDDGLRRQISAGFGFAGVGYAVFAVTEALLPACVAVAFAHVGGSMLWVGSTTYWQRHVDDTFRGRAYALEMLSMTLAFATAGVVAGWAFDAHGSLRDVVWWSCGAVLLSGAAWSLRAGPRLPEPREAVDVAAGS